MQYAAGGAADAKRFSVNVVRFKTNIDKHGEVTAEFVSQCIRNIANS